MASESVTIHAGLVIPAAEITFRSARSGGPGGQNVNKVSSRVTLLFDVDASASLRPSQKRRLHRRLATRINREGVLRVTCQVHRSQAANRREALDRFGRLLAQALVRRRPRVATSVPAATRRRRLEEKRLRGAVKAGRRPVRDEER